MELPPDFDSRTFWEDGEYAQKAYAGASLSEELIRSVEVGLGYQLPAFYVALMRQRNGSIPRNTCFPTTPATTWADDHIAITGTNGIGRTQRYSLRGDLGSQLMLDERERPAIGVVAADCPSAGHDVVMLDYCAYSPTGEPTVGCVD